MFTSKIINYSHLKGLTGSEIIYKKLVEYGINTVSLYSGGAIMPLIDQFHKSKNKDINYYVHSHEQNCGHSATGYAKISGKMGVSIVTSGPGLTNIVTPLLDATNDSTPLMVISGQVSKNVMGSLAFQECPAIEITKPVTKFSYCIDNIEELPYMLDIAYIIANDKKKGSVHIDLPKCIATSVFNDNIYENNINEHSINMEKEIINNKIKYYLNEGKQEYKSSDNKYYIEEISDIINKSEKPILYLGQGANGLSYEIMNFIIKANIPVTTTIHALGLIDQKNSLSLKWLGMHGYAPANYAMQKSDCIICLGARFDDRTTGQIDKFAPNAKNIIHVNVEKSEIKKIVESNYNIVDTTKNFINNIDKYIKFNKRTNWINYINELKEKYSFEYEESKNDELNMPLVIKEINNQLRKKTIITTGVGTHQMQTAQFIEWNPHLKFISSGSLGVMGVGIPYGIGAKLAHPNKDVIVIDGDSSSLMTISDLKTIKEYNIPIKIVILNNNMQGMVNIWEQLFFENRITATTYKNNPSFTKLANSFGIKSLYCDKYSDIKNVINEFINCNDPVLLECNVINDICTPLVKPGCGLDEMIFKKDYINNIELYGETPN